jgi:glutaredoxin 3
MLMITEGGAVFCVFPNREKTTRRTYEGGRASTMDQMRVVLYTRDASFSCWRAKRLLNGKGYAFEEITLSEGDDEVEERGARLDRTISEKRVPFVFVDGRPVGGIREILALDASGVLDRLVRGEV